MENSLQHHGVKGQKWGVHRTPEQLGHRTPAKRKRAVFGRKEKHTTTHKSKSVKDMTDTELREKISRLELEKRYKDLSKPENHARTSKGKAFIEDILEKSGKNIGTQLTTYALGTAVNKMLKTDAVNPKKGQRDK